MNKITLDLHAQLSSWSRGLLFGLTILYRCEGWSKSCLLGNMKKYQSHVLAYCNPFYAAIKTIVFQFSSVYQVIDNTKDTILFNSLYMLWILPSGLKQ